jgi:hypothetical protein
MQSNQKALNDLVFDMVTVLHSKGEGVNAYEKYMRDAQNENSQECMQLFEKLKAQDESAIMEVKEHLSQLLQNGSMSGGSMRSQMNMSRGDSITQ